MTRREKGHLCEQDSPKESILPATVRLALLPGLIWGWLLISMGQTAIAGAGSDASPAMLSFSWQIAFIALLCHLSPSRQKRPPRALAVRIPRVRPCNCDALGCPASRSFRRAPPIPCSSPSAHGRDLRLTPLPLVAHGPTPFGPARILPNALRGNSGRACAHLLHGADRPRALRASRADARRRRP